VRRAAFVPAAALLATGLLAGCGNSRTPVPDVRHPDAPVGGRPVVLKEAGVRFTSPGNWGPLPALGARAGGIRSKTATLAVWRYPRSEPLPTTDAAIRQARDRLVERVKTRDATFELRSSEVSRRDGARAVELVGRQTIAGLPFMVRSTHVFHDGAEVVLDAYAPPEDFERVDRTVFVPVLDTVELGTP
jgi:hypothetical protein